MQSVDLKNWHTFRCTASADTLQIITDPAQVPTLTSCNKFVVLGEGSNVLFVNHFPGTVLINRIPGIEILTPDSDHHYVRAGAGENWDRFVRFLIDKEYGGIENLSLIPGTVGAAPVQNIGAYGVEISTYIHNIEAWDCTARKWVCLEGRDCGFDYRYSNFKGPWAGRYIITAVMFRLPKKSPTNISYLGVREAIGKNSPINAKTIRNAVCRLRNSKLPDPKVLGNAGSFFCNPFINQEVFDQTAILEPFFLEKSSFGGRVKISAARLIEECGFKGFRIGDAGIYPNHALVIVNYGGASGWAVLGLSYEILAAVKKRFNIDLVVEPRLIIS